MKMTDIVVRCSIIFASGREHLSPLVNVETTALETLDLPNPGSNLLSGSIADVLAQFHSPLNIGTGRVLVIDLATTSRQYIWNALADSRPNTKLRHWIAISVDRFTADCHHARTIIKQET